MWTWIIIKGIYIINEYYFSYDTCHFKLIKLLRKKSLYLLLFVFNTTFAQGTFPIYTDYLSDNVFLIHPSAAGIGNCAKLRLTHRQQWSDFSDAPSLQSLSFHSKISEKAAFGGILFNDKNGFHSQKGIQASYAYHLNFYKEEVMNQLSFGLSFMYVQNSVDERNFTSPIPDPVNSQLVESNNYYNADFGLAYHFMDAHTYFTVKNLLLNASDNNNSFQSLNLRRYLLTLGYYFGRGKELQFEPSVMGQFIERTGELSLDINFKAYKLLAKDKQLWGAISYRQNFENDALENLKQITPIIGFNYKRYMVSYTYTSQLNEIAIDNSGFHQFTLGMNLFCKKPRAAACPNIDSIF